MAAHVHSSLPAVAGMISSLPKLIVIGYLSRPTISPLPLDATTRLLVLTSLPGTSLVNFFLAAGNLVLDSHQWKFSTYMRPEKKEKPRKEKNKTTY